MTSLVQEVQQAAIDQNVSLAALLRKAKALSVKLDISSINEWLDRETSGFKDACLSHDEMPQYRVVYGKPYNFHPRLGHSPLPVSAQLRASLSRAVMYESVASIEAMLESKEITMHLSYPVYVEQQIKILFGRADLNPRVQLSRGTITSVLEGVRNTILDWALELEKKGVVGHGMSFSDTDRERAAMATTNISNTTAVPLTQ